MIVIKSDRTPNDVVTCSRNDGCFICTTLVSREIHHFCVLLGYGADAICPYLVFETVSNQRQQGK